METQEGQGLLPSCKHQDMGAVKVISTNALMEQLYLKYQQKPWTETLKLVHFCMDKPLRQPVSNPPDGPLPSCMEKIQRTLNAKSLFSVMNRLESLSKQKGLNSHVSPSGTACYITSDMFYIEVQLEKDGKVLDVKLAHLGEVPVICDDLVQHLRMKNYDAFGKILEDLSNLYQIPGNSEMKAKGYLALQCLEKDLYSISLLDGREDVNRVAEVLHGKVGHLVPRTGDTVHTFRENTKRPGGLSATATLTSKQPKSKASNILRLCGKPHLGSNHEMTTVIAEIILVLPGRQVHLAGTPMNIEFYISPCQVLEAELNPDSQVCGAKIVVTVEGTDILHKLPISPLIADCQAGEDGSPAFLSLTDELSMDLSACFLLKPHQPIPMFSSNIEEIQKLTGIQIAGLKLVPLYELIVQSTLKEKCSEDLSTHNSCFFVSLPDCPKHCYFINKGSEKSDLAGALVSKIPFTHPKCVPGIIEVLRHQMAYNTLISSCVSEKHINEDDSELLYFEVAPQKNTSFSVSFLHPVKDNLACVIIDVITSREIQCRLHLNPEDPTLNSSDDFISRAVERCMSVPIVMRAIFRNAAKVEVGSETKDMEGDTEQKPALLGEPITHPNSLEASPSVAGQQDLVVRDKQSAQDSTEESLSTADLETLGDGTDKSTSRMNTQTSCNAVEESDCTARTEAVMTDAE